MTFPTCDSLTMASSDPSGALASTLTVSGSPSRGSGVVASVVARTHAAAASSVGEGVADACVGLALDGVAEVGEPAPVLEAPVEPPEQPARARARRPAVAAARRRVVSGRVVGKGT